jgi:hypothetical protein
MQYFWYLLFGTQYFNKVLTNYSRKSTMNISVLTKSFGGEMDKREIEKRLLDHVDPNRRSFVRQILGGAALVAPLVATFSIESLIAPEEARAANACPVDDTGYAGPSVFQARFSDPTHTTHANGVATFVITANPAGTFSVKKAQVDYSILLAPPATFVSAYILSPRLLPFGGGDGVAFLPGPLAKGTLNRENVGGLCIFDALLDGLDSEGCSIVMNVEVQGTQFTLSGTIKSVPPSIITLGP